MATPGVDLTSNGALDVAAQADATGTGKLASQVARGIEADVVRQGWPVGRSLGSEMELRERFGVSRSVLREAVRLVAVPAALLTTTEKPPSVVCEDSDRVELVAPGIATPPFSH